MVVNLEPRPSRVHDLALIYCTQNNNLHEAVREDSAMSCVLKLLKQYNDSIRGGSISHMTTARETWLDTANEGRGGTTTTQRPVEPWSMTSALALTC